VYGLSTLAGMMSSGGIKRALLLVGDTITRFISPEDKSTVPIFSDAGTATALEYAPEGGRMAFHLQSDGGGKEAIFVKAGGARIPLDSNTEIVEEKEPGLFRADKHMGMKGLDVSHFALREVAPNVARLLEEEKLSAEALDYVIFHQANLLLNESLRKKLKLQPEQVPYTLGKFGNTSCATIPLTLVSELREVLAKGSHQLLMSGFGVGLSWGSASLQVADLVCPEIIEL